MKKLLLFLLLCASGKSYAQANLYVDSSVSASGSGTSWASAYKTLSEALNTANAASTTVKQIINIAKGTYYPTGIQSGTKRDSAFFIARGGIQLYGGYPAGGGTRNPAANATVLSGNIGAPGTNADNSFHILVVANIPAGADSTIVNGLNFTGGRADSSFYSYYNTISVVEHTGGAIYNVNVIAGILITSCNFYNNSSRGYAGAVYNENSLATITNCSFSGNTITTTITSTGNGGGIYCRSNIAGVNTAVNIIGCSFSNNSAVQGGGAVYYANYNGNGLISRCVFTNNTAFYGGAVATDAGSYASALITSTSIMVDSCVFSGNTATAPNWGGGAVWDYSRSGFGNTYSNCSFSNNTTAGRGGAFYGLAGNIIGSYYVRRCTFTGNRAAKSGGGMYYDCTSTHAGVIDSSSFANNKSGLEGGGLYVAAINGTYNYSNSIHHCSFTADTAQAGGGLWASGVFIATDCSFTLNKADTGGGLYLVGLGAGSLRRDTVQGNVAVYHGGGIYAHGLSPGYQINNCLLAGNKAGGNGGALYDSAAPPIIANCTFAGDTAANGNAIFNNKSSPTIRSCVVWDGTSGIFNTALSVPAIYYSTIQGGYSGGTGILSVNPYFVSPVAAGAAPTTSGNYSLQACSPAIDNAPGYYSGALDLAWNARWSGRSIDQGAYEYQGSSALNGPSALCLNGTALYYSTTPGGIWASSDTSVGIISSTGLFTTTGAGTTTITYTTTASSACGNVSYIIVTVYALPVVGPITALPGDSVCAGGTLSLYVYRGGIWSSSDTTLASINDTVYPYLLTAGTGSGLDTLRYVVTDAGTGCSTTVSKIITVVPLPAIAPITGPDSVCLKGGAFLLTNNTGGGIWHSAFPAIARISAGGLATPMLTGIDSFSYVVTNVAGCSDSVMKQVIINAIDHTVTQNGNELIANQAGATSYVWLDCANGYAAIPGQNQQSFIPSTDGQYAIALSAHGCFDTSVCITIIGTGVGVTGITDSVFTLYPNPSHGTIEIKSSEAGTLQLYDITGSVLSSTMLDKAGNILINMEHLPAGLYQYRFMGKSGQGKAGKLVITR